MAGTVEIQKRWSTDQLINGIELQDLVPLLQKNNWRVDPAYWHRLEIGRASCRERVS
jgi:hypothetical protein